MDRKEFLNTGIIAGAAAITTGFTSSSRTKGTDQVPDYLADLPIYCSHEHWGSLFHIGSTSEGFVADLRPGALPSRRTTLTDLLIDPYLAGSLMGKGIDPRNLPGKNLTEPEETFRELSIILKDLRLKGTYQVLRLGIRFAHSYDLQSPDFEHFLSSSKAIGEHYETMFSWYRQLMTKAALANLMRPVQPEFYFADFSNMAAREELSFTSTLLRIDPFLDFWRKEHSRRDQLVMKLGVDPVDGPTWRTFLEKMLTHVSGLGCIGIKQLQAYSRSLDFEVVKESEVKFRGELSEKEVKRFQDWVMHALCEMANQRKWPHQIHVGTHNHPLSNPLPLKRLATMYPGQKIIMLHCWPYLEESGYLAQAHPNVYIDSCWQAQLNPEFLRQSMNTWLGYIPLNKLTMSHDSTSVEMAAGSSMITRKVLGEALSNQKTWAGLRDPEVREIAAGFLHNNAIEIYGLGEIYQ